MAVLALGVSLGSACSEAPATAQTPAELDAQAPWQGDGQRVSLTSFGYWGGSFEWSAARETLTQAQREALAGLKLIEGSKDCLADIQEYRLVLVDAGGQERTLLANEYDASCSGQELVAMESLRPLLATLSCVGTGQARADLSTTQILQAGDGCRHGFFAYKGEAPRWVKVLPERSGGVHTFQLAYCGGKTTRLELFDGSGTQALTSSSSDGVEDGACPSLSYPLDPEAIYALRVTSEAVTVGGHVVVEVRKD